MLIEVDFNSDEAIYIQLCNQIILGIAMSDIQEGIHSHLSGSLRIRLE